jgi:hypothetical protein
MSHHDILTRVTLSVSAHTMHNGQNYIAPMGTFGYTSVSSPDGSHVQHGSEVIEAVPGLIAPWDSHTEAIIKECHKQSKLVSDPEIGKNHFIDVEKYIGSHRLYLAKRLPVVRTQHLVWCFVAKVWRRNVFLCHQRNTMTGNCRWVWLLFEYTKATPTGIPPVSPGEAALILREGINQKLMEAQSTLADIQKFRRHIADIQKFPLSRNFADTLTINSPSPWSYGLNEIEARYREVSNQVAAYQNASSLLLLWQQDCDSGLWYDPDRRDYSPTMSYDLM